MKKILYSLLIAVAALSFAPSANANEILDKVVLYLPNRVVDAFDLFSANLGFGPKVQAEIMATRAFAFGGNVGSAAMLYKDCNRQYGWGLENGWRWELGWLEQEDTERTKTSRFVQGYWEDFFGVPTPDQSVYEWQHGARDYWQFGGSLSLLVCADLYVNPIDWVDFALGFLFIDIKDDDLTMESFQ